MKYIDLHTDALTKEGVRSVTKETLARGGCALECFACFTPRGDLGKTLKLCDKFQKMCLDEGFRQVKRGGNLAGEGMLAMLTVEGGEAVGGDLGNLRFLHEKGVRMLTLVWNFDNDLGTSHTTSERERGLTPFGRAAVELMGELGMIADISHGSDALFFDVAAWSKRTGIPFVASHSNARACREHTRNLSDGEIRTLADCGGVMGLNFYDKFLAADRSCEGQKAAMIAHMTHILKVGGEDVLAFGSDFDGCPQNAYIKTAADMPRLLFEMEKVFPHRVVEKVAYGNAARVIQSVLDEKN